MFLLKMLQGSVTRLEYHASSKTLWMGGGMVFPDIEPQKAWRIFSVHAQRLRSRGEQFTIKQEQINE